MNDVPRDGTTMGEVVMPGNNVMSGHFNDETAPPRRSWAVGSIPGTLPCGTRTGTSSCATGERTSSSPAARTSPASKSSRRSPLTPAVLKCAVIGIPHPHWGERPEAFVTLNEGAAATEQEIIAFCRDRLAHYKCPDAIQFGPLPKTPTGKIQKFVLREPEWKGQDKRISCLGGFGVVLSAGEVLGVVEQAVGQVVGGSARGGR